MAARYIEKVTSCGEDYRRINIYVERPCGRGRGRKCRPTSDAQQRLNRRNAETRLSDLLHNNFSRDDFAVRLDYNTFIDKNGRNPSEKEARAKLTYFLTKLRRIYTSLGADFRYCYNIEIGSRAGKVHHHLIISGSPDREIRAYLRDAIEETWKHGYCNVRRLEFDASGIKGLAHYLSKDDTTCAKRWIPSQGLIRPSEDNGLVERSRGKISARAAKHIDAHPDDVSFLREQYPGWYTLEVRTTGQAQYDDAIPAEVPGEQDASRHIVDGMILPDYGGVFIELWQFREDAAFLREPQYAWLAKRIRALGDQQIKKKRRAKP